MFGETPNTAGKMPALPRMPALPAPQDAGLDIFPFSVFHRGLFLVMMRAMNDVPALILDDPWLAPYETAIRDRHTRLVETIGAIKAESGSLAAYATGHKFTGIHYQAADNHWIIREWAPRATAVFLIGEFNQWNRESHPLAPAGRGIWQLRLPGDALAHGQLVKLHIVGADGSRRDRIPACIQRAV